MWSPTRKVEMTKRNLYQKNNQVLMLNKKAGRWILGENNNLFYEQLGTSRAIGSEDKVGELFHEISFWKFVFTYI